MQLIYGYGWGKAMKRSHDTGSRHRLRGKGDPPLIPIKYNGHLARSSTLVAWEADTYPVHTARSSRNGSIWHPQCIAELFQLDFYVEQMTGNCQSGWRHNCINAAFGHIHETKCPSA